MSDRTEEYTPRTLDKFIEQGLYPCNGCLRSALQFDGPSIFGYRVYCEGDRDTFPLGARTCEDCRFIVLSSGTFGVAAHISREVYRRKAEADRRGHDAPTDVSTQVPTGGGPVMRHGDSKTDFSTGAQRDTDEGKGKPSLISPVLIHRLGVHLAEGAKHYGADNWTEGMPYRRTADSMIRHIFQWLAGDEEEDHLAAVCFGAMCLMTYEAAAEDRLEIPKSPLDDRCSAFKEILASLLTSVSPSAKLEVKSVHKSVDDFVESQRRMHKTTVQDCKGSCGGKTMFEDGYCVKCTLNDENPGMTRC